MSDFSTIGGNSAQLTAPVGPTTTPNALDLSVPDSMLGGTMRATQNIGTGGPQIDSANNRILLTNSTDGSSIGMGTIPGSTTGEFGFFALDKSGNVIMKIVNGNLFMLDPTANNITRVELGLLPDGTYNLATSKPGQDLLTAFS